MQMDTQSSFRSIRNGHVFILKYSLLFFLSFFVGCALWFMIAKKSFVYNGDALVQHVPALQYWGEYLRKFFSELFLHGRIKPVFWDSSLGFGSDVLTTLHYYVIGDPLALTSIFVPKSRTEYLYSALIIVRIYFAGAAFAYFARERGNELDAILVGTIPYCFCGYVMVFAFWHPFFINNMIYLPLICAGIDKIYEGKKPIPYICITALSAISNFYFFYMLAIMQFIYAVLEYFRRYKRFQLKKALLLLLKFVCFYVVGILLASTILLPNVIAVLNSNRMAINSAVPLLNDLYYYISVPSTIFFTYNSTQSSANMINGVIAAIIFAGFFIAKKEIKQYKAAIIISFVFLVFPVFSWIFSGMNRITDRWYFAFPLLTSFFATEIFPDLFKLTSEKRKKYLFYSTILFEVTLFSAGLTKNFIIVQPCIFFASTVILSVNHEKRPHIISIAYKILPVLICICIAANGFNLFSYYNDGSEMQQHIDVGDSDKIMRTDSPVSALQNLQTGSFWRYDSNCQDVKVNSSIINNLHGAASYFSLSSPYLSDYNYAIGLNTIAEDWTNDLDSRAIPDLLASVRYFIIEKGMQELLPYGYDKLANEYTNSSGKTFQVYENPDSLPLAYTYSTYIPQDTFDSLSSTEKQKAMLQGVVLSTSSLPVDSTLDFDDSSSECVIIAGKGVNSEDNSLYVSKTNDGIQINCSRLGPGENYLLIEGMTFQAERGNMSGFDSDSSVLSDFMLKILPTDTESTCCFCCDDNTETVNVSESGVNGGRDSILINISALNASGDNNIKCLFERAGEYKYNKFTIVNQPMDDIASEAAALKKDVLENIVIDGNTINGDIDLDTSKFLLYSIPYSKGWTAYVDGQKAELKNANIMFMGMELAPGSHHIVLKYCTPGLKAGAIISTCGVAAFAALLSVIKKRNRTGLDKNENKKPGTRLNNHQSSRKWFLIAFISAEVCFIFSLLYNYPGVTTFDSNFQMLQAVGVTAINNHHPVVHTLLIRLFFLTANGIGGSPDTAVCIYSAFQLTCMALTFAYCVSILAKNGADGIFLGLTVIFYGTAPINMQYAVTMWKDVLFGAFVLIYTLELWQINDKLKFEEKPKRGDLAAMALSGAGFCLFRTNGIIAFALLTAVLVFVFFKKSKAFVCVNIAVLIISMIIVGPFYSVLGFKENNPIEALAVPTQQIAAVCSYGGAITESQAQFLTNVCNLNELAENYTPDCVNTAKDYIRSYGNQFYITEHKAEFIRIWAQLGLKNPKIYIKAYWTLTRGFVIPSDDGLTIANWVYKNDLGIYKKTIIGNFAENCFTKYLMLFCSNPAKIIFSIGTFDFVAAVLFVANAIKKKFATVLLFLPTLFIFFTIMISTPVSGEFRYMYSLFISLPILSFLTFYSGRSSIVNNCE